MTKRRWVLLNKGERVLKGDKMFDWNGNHFCPVGSDVESPRYDPFIVDREHVIRKVLISGNALRHAKLAGGKP